MHVHTGVHGTSSKVTGGAFHPWGLPSRVHVQAAGAWAACGTPAVCRVRGRCCWAGQRWLWHGRAGPAACAARGGPQHGRRPCANAGPCERNGPGRKPGGGCQALCMVRRRDARALRGTCDGIIGASLVHQTQWANCMPRAQPELLPGPLCAARACWTPAAAGDHGTAAAPHI